MYDNIIAIEVAIGVVSELHLELLNARIDKRERASFFSKATEFG
jgi:hypothetical protein